MKSIALLGSTGSIGTQTLEVCKNIGIEVKVLSGHRNTDLLKRQTLDFKPEAVLVSDDEKALELKRDFWLSGIKAEVLSGDGAFGELFDIEFDVTVNALVGSVGLLPTLMSIEKRRNVALANKETLVAGGELVMAAAKAANVGILPIDSEHSAIFQCLEGNRHNEIDKIYLTASGGPFRSFSSQQLKEATLEDALKHPNWSMGKKITVDSATLMNKGLEVIEAVRLYSVLPSKIEVLVHPQSIVHSMVGFTDGSVIAQLGMPDMRVPIQYALTYPDRKASSFPALDFIGKSLTFEKPRWDDFPCLGLAFEALESGGLFPAVMNAANEAAVAGFIEKKISFDAIFKIIRSTLDEYNIKNKISVKNYNVSDVTDADKWAREYAGRLVLGG